MPIIRSSRPWCWLPHRSFRSWFAVCWRLGAVGQPGHYSSLTAPNLQHTANQERNDRCGNQQHIRELLMMGRVMPETCWAYKKYNKIISGIYLVFYSSVITMMHGPISIRNKIISMLEQNGLKIKGIKKWVRTDINEALLKWFKQRRSDTVPVSCPLLKTTFVHSKIFILSSCIF